jgi:hypothetical protein
MQELPPVNAWHTVHIPCTTYSAAAFGVPESQSFALHACTCKNLQLSCEDETGNDAAVSSSSAPAKQLLQLLCLI